MKTTPDFSPASAADGFSRALPPAPLPSGGRQERCWQLDLQPGLYQLSVIADTGTGTRFLHAAYRSREAVRIVEADFIFHSTTPENL